MKTTRLVILGSSGRLGHALAEKLPRHAHVFTIPRDRLDLADPRAIHRTLAPLDFDEVLLPAALTGVDHCESHPEEAFAINHRAPGLVAALAAEKNARLTFFSTDFVFDGSRQRPCLETDEAKPISIYGRSKLEGERAVLAASSAHLVIRLSWLYGGSRPAFPEWILQQLLEKEAVSLPAEKTGSPTLVDDVVDHLIPLLDLHHREPEPAFGIYHLANSGTCSWQAWGQFVATEAYAAGLPLKTRMIEPCSLQDIAAFRARRPIHSALDTAKLRKRLGTAPRPWDSALHHHLHHSGLLGASSLAYA